MSNKYKERFEELINQGRNLIRKIPHSSDLYEPEYWVSGDEIPEFQAWLSSSMNLIHMIAPAGSYFQSACNEIAKHKDLLGGIPSQVVQKVYGLLVSARDELDKGLLTRVEYIVAAETFDDFLDHAVQYHKANKKTEASVLSSAVLEDTMKKIAAKSGIQTSGASLEALIDESVKIGVLTPVKAKRVKAYAGVRNHALHAEWDKFDIRDVGEMLQGIRELIDEFLG